MSWLKNNDAGIGSNSPRAISGVRHRSTASARREFCARWAPRIINTHPASLPECPGAHGVRDAIASGTTQTGASVIVVDHGIDSGPILAQERIAILPGDDEAALHERIKPVERRLLIDVVRRIATGEIDLSAATAAASN